MFSTRLSLSRAATCLAVAAFAATMGCRGLGFAGIDSDDSAEMVSQMTPAPIRIVYRTKTDRLNLTGASLPPCSMATLQIQSPHPHYKANTALARLMVAPCSTDAELTPEDLATLTQQATAQWEGEIPLWQVETIVKQLETANFFRRSKTLNPKSFLAADAPAGRLGKRYREVTELDAMVVRLSNTDSPQLSNPNRQDLARLPAVSAR